MIKRLWWVTSVLAVAVVGLAVGGLGVLWLQGRLDAERIDAVREAWFDAGDRSSRSTPPVAEVAAEVGSSSRILEARARGGHQDVVSRQLLTQEAAARQRQIEIALLEVAQAREELEAERRAFEIRQRTVETPSAARDRAAQFRRAVQLIESAPAGQAKIWLVAMVERGDFAEAVATLDAMRERAASRILREFKSAREMELAGQLLEELGRFGTDSPVATDRESVRAAITRQPDFSP